MLRVLIVDNDLKRSKPLKQSLIDNGFDVIAHVEDDMHLQTKCCELQPDIVIIDTESPSRDILDNVCMITQHNTRPVVMFSQDGDREIVKPATKVGICADIVQTISSERLTSVIESAVARFEEAKQLRNELQLSNEKSDDSQVIERAKVILMRQLNIDEDEASKILHSMAMKRNVRLANLANQLIDAAKMLTI